MRLGRLLLLLVLSAPAFATVCGVSTVGGSGSFVNGAEVAGTTCIPTSNSTVNSLNVDFSSSFGGNFAMAIRDSNGGSGKPGTLLCYTGSVAMASGWNTATPSSCPTLVSGHTYWIIANISSGAYAYTGGQPSGTSYSGNAETCCGSFTVAPTANALTNSYSMYADVTGSTPTAATPTISPAGGMTSSAPSVTMSCSTPSSTIYYTTDGTTPTHSSSVYSSAITPGSNATTQVQALCAASGYLDSAVASQTYYVYADVAIISDNFSSYYDANRAQGGQYQAPLDVNYTSGHWRANVAVAGQVIGSVSVAASDGYAAPYMAAMPLTSDFKSWGNPIQTCAAATSGVCVYGPSTGAMSTVNSRTGFADSQFASAKLATVSSGSAATVKVAVNAPQDGATQTGYTLKCTAGSGSGTIDIEKMVAGSNTTIALSTSCTVPAGATCELRRGGGQIQALVNGSVPPCISDHYALSSPLTGGAPAILGGGAQSDFAGGNVGVADGTSAVSWTPPANGSYTDTMSGSGWTPGFPWTPMPAGSGTDKHWYGLYGAKASGGVYNMGLALITPVTSATRFTTSQMYYRGFFGSEQEQEVTILRNTSAPTLMNTFLTLQHFPYAPGNDNCRALAAGACEDWTGYYFGIEPMTGVARVNGWRAACNGKAEYICTAFLHLTKITPASSPNNDVLTIQGSFYTPMAGDKIHIEYVNNHTRAYCNGHGANGGWPGASQTVTAGTVITDPNGNLQVTFAGGTTGSSAPTFGVSWGNYIPYPTVTPSGGVSTSTYKYAVAAYSGDPLTVHGAANADYDLWMGTSMDISVLNASTLDSSHYNTITTAAVSGSTECRVWRTSPLQSDGTPGYVGVVSCGSSITDNSASLTTSPGYVSPNWDGMKTQDGTVLWDYYGEPCATNGSWTKVIDAVDTDLSGAGGYPGFFLQNLLRDSSLSSQYPAPYDTDNLPFFSTWSAGTVTNGGLCTTLSGANGCNTQQPVVNIITRAFKLRTFASLMQSTTLAGGQVQ